MNMETTKSFYLNRSNGNKPATDNELIKFGLVSLAKLAFIDEDGDFSVITDKGAFKLIEFKMPEGRVESAKNHLEKHVEAIETKFSKSSDIVKAVVKTEFTILE